MNAKLQFCNGESILYLFDELIRGHKKTEYMHEPLDIVVSQEEWASRCNRPAQKKQEKVGQRQGRADL